MMIALVLLIIFLGLFVWMFFVEPNWFHLRRIKMTGQKKLHKPISILHLSDIHFVKEPGAKRAFFQKLSMLNPDLLFLTGDIIDCDEGIDTAVQMISGIRARYGTFLVLGNHDYYNYRWFDNFRYHLGFGKTTLAQNNISRFVQELKKIGVYVLVNQSVKLQVHGTSVFIAGTDDPVTQRVDFEAALHGMSPESFNILLIHHLDGLLKLSHHGIHFAFAGHTHGGQIRLPLWGPIVCETKLPRKYVSGLHQYKDTTVFISQGMGAGRTMFPRFACRPEAIFFELTP